jgi:hypothetical protein
VKKLFLYHTIFGAISKAANALAWYVFKLLLFKLMSQKNSFVKVLQASLLFAA